MPLSELEQAAADYAADLAALAEMDDDQVAYLTAGPDLDDPLSDGIDCDTDERDEG